MATPSQARAETLTRLEALACELTDCGWVTRLHAPTAQVPSLYVQNPDPGAAMLSEHIYAAQRADGTWSYWWPWAQALPPAVRDATDTIIRVLHAADAR
jgi:hypothetical protein